MTSIKQMEIAIDYLPISAFEVMALSEFDGRGDANVLACLHLSYFHLSCTLLINLLL